MRIVICEDNGYMLDEVAQACQQYTTEEDNICCYHFSKHLKQDILEKQPKVDLFLLDIEMPDVDGMELKQLISTRYEDTSIAFLTSHDELMREAFGKKVIAFLKKDDYAERLKDVIAQVRREIEDGNVVQLWEGTEVRTYLQRKIMVIEAERINTMLHLVSSYNADTGYVDVERRVHRISLREWEQQLNMQEFCRISRSVILSWRYVRTVGDCIEMVDGSCYRIPSGKKRQLRECYHRYCERQERYY